MVENIRGGGEIKKRGSNTKNIPDPRFVTKTHGIWTMFEEIVKSHSVLLTQQFNIPGTPEALHFTEPR